MTDSIYKTKCPLCGGDNLCQNIVNSSTQQFCWCKSTKYIFSEELLNRIPAKFKDKVCICESCAQAYQKT